MNIEIEVLAGEGKLEALKKCFENGFTQEELNIALENAIAYSQLNTAEYLLSLGADITYYDYQGVYYAVHNNELIGLQYAITKGVDINFNKGLLLNTAIVSSINSKDTQLLKWMLENGANANLLSKGSLVMTQEFGTEELKKLLEEYS